jgi:TonB family protein
MIHCNKCKYIRSLMNRIVLVAVPLLLFAGAGFAGEPEGLPTPAVFRPSLLPGCALPSPKLIAAAAPVNIELLLATDPAGSVVGVETRRSSGNGELDAAFVDAARACRFAPVPHAGVAGGRKLEYRLEYRYAGGPPTTGVHACFSPDYPPLAMRRQEEGTTTVAFLVPAGDSAPQVKVILSSGSRSLDAGSLLMASSCLANPSVRADLAPDRWYRQSVMWVLQ